MADLDSLIAGLDALLPSQKRKCLELIQKAVRNVADNPREEKYRRLKKDNPKVAESIAKHPQAEALFAYCGWSRTSDNRLFVCAPPSQQLLTQMQETLDILDALLVTEEEATPESSIQESMGSMGIIEEQVAPATSGGNQVAPATSGGSGYATQQRATTPPKNATTKPGTPPPKSAFAFERAETRREKEEAAKRQEDDIRERRKQQFEQHKKDPDAKNSDVYKKPASIAPGGKASGSTWYNPGTWFGGDDDKKPDKKKPPPRTGSRNPRTLGDLPKPAQGG